MTALSKCYPPYIRGLKPNDKKQAIFMTIQDVFIKSNIWVYWKT